MGKIKAFKTKQHEVDVYDALTKSGIKAFIAMLK